MCKPSQGLHQEGNSYAPSSNDQARELRIANVMHDFRCSKEDAVRFIDLRNEGYGRHQAAVMAGIADPSE